MSSRIERIVAMHEEIQKGRYPSVQKFCEMFEVGERTVYDDLRRLRDYMGIDIEYDRYRNGYFNKNPNKKLPLFELSAGEVFALTLGKEMLSEYTGTAFEQILRSALEKIRDRLPDRVELDFEDVTSMVKFNPGPVIRISKKLFFDLTKACEKHMSVEIEYYSASRGELTERTVDPYKLMDHRGTWYLIAYCHLRNALRLFALHRINGHTLLQDTKFSPMDQETMDAWMSSPFLVEHREQEQNVKVHFQPSAARYIRERKWHQTQELTEHQDGSCTLSFVTPSLEEVKRWLVTYGPNAYVIEPELLRNMIVEDMSATIRRYQVAK